MINDNLYGESGQKYKAFWYWLSNIDEFSSSMLMRIANKFNCPEEVIALSKNDLMAKCELTEAQSLRLIRERNNIRRSQEKFEMLSDQGIQMITCLDDVYPHKLRNIKEPPFVLYVKGTLPDENLPTAAIVGSRNCTEYGRKIATDYSRHLAFDGIQTISGMAQGIDQCCHKGTLKGKGKTWAVMGCGIDICYPASGYNLYRSILENGGGIISEYPPGTSSVGWHFPYRNRIISGLADCVVVVEAQKKSGTQITVDYALEQGRDVFAVPGRVYDKCSSGCFQMINDGASILYEYDQLRQFFGINSEDNSPEKGGNNEKIILANNEHVVYSALSCAVKGIDELLSELDITPADLHTILLKLQLDGLIEEVTPKRYTALSI